MNAYALLRASLIALAALYVAWFVPQRDWAAVAVFALPPLVLAMYCGGTRAARAAFWAGLCALLWFSHGVMAAWTRPAEHMYALAEVALALCVVFTASAPGLRARFGGRGRH